MSNFLRRELVLCIVCTHSGCFCVLASQVPSVEAKLSFFKYVSSAYRVSVTSCISSSLCFLFMHSAFNSTFLRVMMPNVKNSSAGLRRLEVRKFHKGQRVRRSWNRFVLSSDLISSFDKS